MNPIQELLQRAAELDELGAEELGALDEELIQTYDAVVAGSIEGVDAHDVDTLTQIADATQNVRQAASARAEAAAETEAAVAALSEIVHAGATAQVDDDAEGDDTAEDSDGDEDGEDAEPVDNEDDSDDEDNEDSVEDESVAVTAAATLARPLAPLGEMRARRPAAHRPAARSGDGLIVSGRVYATPNGGAITSISQLVSAFNDRRRSFGNVVGGISEKVSVARMDYDLPDARTLHRGDADANTAKIEAVTAGAMDPSMWADALTASGGWCAPVNVDYSIVQISESGRPVRDSMPRFNADRGGVKFVEPPDMTQVLQDTTGAALTLHTNAEDIAGGTKTCQHVDCPDEVEVILDAIVRCLEFGNFQARAFPELTEVWLRNLLAAYDRKAESKLLDEMALASTKVTHPKTLGAARDILHAITRAAAGFRSRHRMSRTARLHVWLPEWVPDLIAADLVAQAPGDGMEHFNVDEGTIRTWLGARNVNVTFYMDSETGAGQIWATQGAGELREFPSWVVWYITHEGAFQFLDGGTLDLGLVRDSTLNETNDYQIFAEGFEALAFRGLESLRVAQRVCPDGSSQEPIDEADRCTTS